MDYSSDDSSGQLPVLISRATVAQIAQVCDFIQMLRAWYGHFDPSLRKLDETAAVKAHDLMIEGVTTARSLARTLAFSLPPTDDISWALSPRPSAIDRQ